MRFAILLGSAGLLLLAGLAGADGHLPSEREAAAPEAGKAKPVKTTPKPKKYPSGLLMTVIEEGEGPSPSARDTVRVHYHGTFADGKVFDSSVKRGRPARFPLNRVIPCWTEGVQKMKVGGKARLKCPPSIAYGARGAPPSIPPNATLYFDVELLSIE